MKKSTLLALALAAILAAMYVALPYLRQTVPPEPLPAETPREPVKNPVPEQPPVLHPVPTAPTAQEEKLPPSLPALDESDEAMGEAMSSLFPRWNPARVLVLDHFIRRFVVTVDGLPRRQLPVDRMPTRPASDTFQVTGPEGQEVISPENARRYAPFVALAEALDTEQAITVYVRFYPLFQKAYRDLGYPKGYFNDRLIAVIDHLLATPEVDEPVRLTRHVVRYRFASPELESLSAGQKILIRIGVDNARKVKGKLRELRAGLIALPRQ